MVHYRQQYQNTIPFCKHHWECQQVLVPGIRQSTVAMQIVPAVGLLVVALYQFSSAQLVVEVSVESNVSLAGTRQSLNCSVDPLVSASFMWLVDDKILETDSRVTVSNSSLYSSMLEFNPLRTSDGGQYQCVVTVMSGGAAVNITDEINLNVTSKWTSLS